MDKEDRLLLLEIARLLTALGAFVFSGDDGRPARADWDALQLRLEKMRTRMENY